MPSSPRHRTAGLTHATAQTGAVTLIQRFGSAPNLNIHFHMLFLEGVYLTASDPLNFRRVPPPTVAALEALVRLIAEGWPSMLKCPSTEIRTYCDPPAMSRALDALLQTLTVTPLGEHRWQGRGSTDDGADGTYGGHYLGQATAALLADSGDGRALHSLHAYFLRSGRAEQAYEYTVEHVREGRSFSNRRVQCWQQDKLIFEMTASLMAPETGVCLKPSVPDDFATLPAPESLARYGDVMRGLDPLPLPTAWALRAHGIDLRPINAPWCERGVSAAGGIRHWIRADGTVPDDTAMHTALLAYQSDESISDNILIPFGVNWGAPGLNFVSLDHAMWFHQAVDLNDWLLIEQWPARAGGGRGLAHGRVWNRVGELVVSFSQEALLRFAP